MKFLPLVWRNLLRRKTRTTLTFLAVLVSFLLFGVLTIVRVAFTGGVEMAGVDRLMTIHKVAIIQPLPIAYLERIRSVPGVVVVSHASWFGGIYQDPKNNVFEFAVEPVSYMKMYPEYTLPPEQMQAWLADRQGAVVGKDLAARFDWKLGDKIPIKGTFNRPKGGDGVTWEFNLVGIYDGEPSVDKTQFLFRHDYLDENRRGGEGMTGWYILKIDDPSKAPEIASRIDAMFANSSYETKTTTEKAIAQSFANQVGNIGFMMTSILTLVLFIILLIAASQMALAVRERTNELAALKAMGFSDRLVLVLVLAESLSITVLAGAVGLFFAWLIAKGGDPTGGLLPVFMLPPRQIAIGLALAATLGLLAGAMPAIGAMRLRITDALRRQ
jgi:putative ABC transport system permease protein